MKELKLFFVVQDIIKIKKEEFNNEKS